MCYNGSLKIVRYNSYAMYIYAIYESRSASIYYTRLSYKSDSD